MKIKITILLSFLLFTFSCAKNETEIQGEIFIATKGGQSYKLGAIPVKIVKKLKTEGLNDKEVKILSPDYTATTDADGKFSIKIPTGEYVVIVEAKRDVFGKTENYFWRVDIKAQGEETKVSLNNQNMSDE